LLERDENMNDDISDAENIVIQKAGGSGRKSVVEIAGSGDEQSGTDFAPSSEAGKGTVGGIKGWAVITKGKARTVSSTMSAKAATKATPTKTLAATTEFECKGNAEQSLMDQVVFALRSLVETLCNQVEDLGNKHGSLQKITLKQSSMVETQGRRNAFLKALLRENVRKPTYSEAT
jgi:hypothetical protein